MGGIHQLAELIPGAANYMEMANIQPGEEVLVIPATDCDEIVIEAVIASVRMVGATPTVAYAPPPELYFHEAPDSLVEAMCAADTVLDLGAFVWGHSDGSLRAMAEYLTKGALLIPPTPARLRSEAALFPIPLIRAIARKVYDQVQKPDGTKIRVTSPSGTDLTAEVFRTQTGTDGYMKPLAPGEFHVFPSGVVGFVPPLNVNGEAIFEAYTGFGRLSEPVTFVIKEGYVTRIKGGWEAREIETRIEGAVNGNHVCEIMWGIVPKNNVDLETKPISMESERSPRTLHIGLGDVKLNGGPKRAVGEGPHWSTLHQDGYMMYPTLVVGEDVVQDHGHLTILDDPEIAALARQYGDPKQVLSYGEVRA
ncbi:MAG: hypothetical protein ACE5JS_02590 [Nitrospinota bacterium]